MGFVNHVRDRQDADVHIFFSSQRTGGQGEEVTLYFIGLNKFKGINDTLRFVNDRTDTDDTEREKMANKIKLGLIKYVSKSPIADKINITYEKPVKPKTEIQDDWNFWVFQTSIDSWFQGEESTNSLNFWGSISANRVTEDWKLRFSISGEYNESNYDIDDTTSIKDVSRSQHFRSHIIKSLDENWSAGIWLSGNSSTYSNLDYQAVFAPDIEYNLFPYSESNRKQLRFVYNIWVIHNRYLRETIYFKTKETVLQQGLSITLELIQPWGNISTSLSGHHFLKDISLNSIDLWGNVDIKIIKGLSFDIYGGFRAIHNQIALPLEGATIQEVLLRRRQLETQYEYWGSFGFSFTFGSIYNNIVNPRFGD